MYVQCFDTHTLCTVLTGVAVDMVCVVGNWSEVNGVRVTWVCRGLLDGHPVTTVLVGRRG